MILAITGFTTFRSSISCLCEMIVKARYVLLARANVRQKTVAERVDTSACLM
jgi:hypothetical protein